ncbi:hypothetical protein A9Q90_02700 [Gammaproteobacteria bacterium 54_18_T64]|nr:hypothetical protein A9Q90_02700 [Gammaproteobacteria bacterium 54_18_T64]
MPKTPIPDDTSYQALLEAMQTFVAILETVGTLGFANKTPLKIAGIELNDVIGKKFWDCFWFNYDPTVQTNIRDFVRRAAAGELVHEEIQGRIATGLLWIDFKIQAVFEAGKAIKLVAEGSDISEQKLLREQDRLAQQRLQGLFNDMQSMVAILDTEGRVDLINNTPLQVADLEQSDVLGKLLWDSPWFQHSASTQQRVRDSIESAATGNAVRCDVQLNTSAGVIWLEFNVHPVFDDAGKVCQLVAEGSDPRARREVELEREQVLLELEAREQNLAITLDSIGDAVITTDANALITRMNPIAEQLTGWSLAEALQQPLAAVFPIYDASSGERLASPVDKLMATGEIVHLSNHATLRTREGHVYQIADSAAPIRDKNNHIIGAILVFSDVSEQYRLRERAKVSQQRLQGLFDDMQTMVGLYDLDGTTTFINNTPLLATGFKEEEIIGKKLWETPFLNYSKEAVAQVRGDLHKAAMGKITLADREVITRQGDKIWIALSFHPVFDDNGYVVQILGEGHDITATRSAQIALANSEKTQREILDSMVEGIVVTDELGSILSINVAAEKLLNYRADELIGQHVARLILEQDEAIILKNMQSYFQSGDITQIGMGLEMTAVCKDGATFPTVLAVAELSPTADGKRRFINSFRDLSDTKQQEEQLRRSQKMDALGKLTGGIAHDFNNMLGIVTGYADLLAVALSNEDKLAQYAHEIHRAGERGANLTRKLLAFSQQKAVSTDSVDINALVGSQQHMLETSLTPRIKLVYELCSAIWPTRLDSDDLEDAIINMCINAMHAIEANGQVTIRTDNLHLSAAQAQQKNVARGDYVQLSISDTGEGMNEATKQQIFDPFYTTKGEQGTGLGLSQVYGFIERSKGAIEVSSVIGRGTELRLYFPRDMTQVKSEDTNIAGSETASSGCESILVVDDETTLLALCAEILGRQNYTVLTAANCTEALAILDNNKVDLMFSDVVMPDMNGYELADIVSAKYPTVKIQMTSGFTGDKQPALTDDTLQQNLLTKPYRAQALLTKIRELLDS